MEKGGWTYPEHASLPTYTWKEIEEHGERTDRWIAVDGYVYDVTNWGRRHPGGEKVISGWAGHDASEAWYAFHTNKDYVSKFMKPFLVGRVHRDVQDFKAIEKQPATVLEDFHIIRETAEREGFFRPSSVFYVFIMAHILFFDFLGWWTMRTFGIGWISYIIAAIFLTVAQIQAAWSQHDYGHLAVFHNKRWNHWTQIFLFNIIHGLSSEWWNFRHRNHHSKTNVLTKDPGVSFAPFFLIGDTVATEYGRQKKNYLPYASQHKYFFFVMLPLMMPLIFNIEIPYFLLKRRRWMELFWTALFFVRWQIMFSSMLGFGGAFALFLFVKFLESPWFVWAILMNHIPMPATYDSHEDWATLQVKASCNVEQSLFNDWWSGHQNFQIEHHLFPTMPRHNLAKVAPLVQTFCKKHGLPYENKTLFRACADVVRTLENSGQTWLAAYNM